LAGFVPLVAVLEATECLRRHPSDIERAAVVPRDEPTSDVCRVEFLLFDEASSNAERLLSVIRNRTRGLVPRSVPDHLVEPTVFSTDLRRRLELDWPAERIPTR
jgi:hypothetical protein